MSIIDSIQKRIAKRYIEKRYSLADLDRDMDVQRYGTPAYSGVTVSETTALNYGPLFTCVRILSETVAKVPFEFYRRIPRGKEKATDHPLYGIIHDVANPEMTSYQFRETLQGHLCVWGNAYAEIQYDPSFNVIALWPLRPDKMTDIKRIDGKLWYQYRLPDQYGQDVMLPAIRVLHIPFMGYNGVAGYSPISLARQTIGSGMAVEEYGARFFSNGSRPSGVIKMPGPLSKEAGERVRASWEQMYQGLSNQHRTAILEDGMEFQQIGVPPEEAQFLETQNFTARQIASWYGIPANKVGAELTNQTYSNIEAQGIDAVNDIMPWFRRWESIYSFKLLGPEERKTYFAEFNLNGLMRGDAVARATYYRERFNIGTYSMNDIREIENENPIDDPNADKYWIGLNVAPIGERPAAQPKEAPVQPDQIARALEPVFREASREIVEKEARDIERARKRADFGQWARDYYQTLPEAIEKRMAVPVESLASIHPGATASAVQGHLRACARDYANMSREQVEDGVELQIEHAITWLVDRSMSLPV